MTSIKTLILCTAAAGLLSACVTTSPSQYGAQKDSGSRIDAALQRAAADASQDNSLAVLGRIYKRNSNSSSAATDYAQALREAGQIDKAALVMEPFAHDKKSSSAVKSEYAAIQLAAGHYGLAEDFSRRASEQDKKNFKAFHYLGIAQDALGQHEDAELAFRQALENWDGNPVPVLNNLALNLSTQKRNVEAAEMIQRAAALAPQRGDVQANKHIILALQDRYITPPIPSTKPKT